MAEHEEVAGLAVDAAASLEARRRAERQRKPKTDLKGGQSKPPM